MSTAAGRAKDAPDAMRRMNTIQRMDVADKDLDWSHHLRPALTTLHVPTDITWTGAGEYILARLEGHPVPSHYEIDYSLIIRESTSALR